MGPDCVGLDVVHVVERDRELVLSRLEPRHELRSVNVLGGGGRADLAKPGASALHEAHAVEDIGDDGVASLVSHAVFDDVVGQGCANLPAG